MKLNGEWEIADTGVTRRMVALGDHIMAVHVRFEAGAIGAAHQHPHEQLTRVLSGKFRFQIGDDIVDISTGDTICIKGGVVHGTVALEDGELFDVFTPIREDFLDQA